MANFIIKNKITNIENLKEFKDKIMPSIKTNLQIMN
jgi:hypothetical protein